MTREGIATALFDLLLTVPGVKTCSRKLKPKDEVNTLDMPAMFLTLGGWTPIQSIDGLPTIWKHEYLIYVLINNSDPYQAPSTALNNIMDGIEEVLRPVSRFGPPGFPGTVQVLGDTTGRIRHAWVSGNVFADEGVLGDLTLAVIPIEIEVA